MLNYSVMSVKKYTTHYLRYKLLKHLRDSLDHVTPTAEPLYPSHPGQKTIFRETVDEDAIIITIKTEKCDHFYVFDFGDVITKFVAKACIFDHETMQKITLEVPIFMKTGHVPSWEETKEALKKVANKYDEDGQVIF
jgi:hypothetical protein